MNFRGENKKDGSEDRVPTYDSRAIHSSKRSKRNTTIKRDIIASLKLHEMMLYQ